MIYSCINYWFLGEIIRRLTGQAIDGLARDRVFAPLGMHDSYHVVPESAAGRVVRRPPEAPFATVPDGRSLCLPDVPDGRYSLSINSRELEELPDAAGGAFSTPRDIAIFCQMFLNGGRYGEARILSPASVAAMTRNQIPGVPAEVLALRLPEASYGYGWSIASYTQWKYLRPSLPALGTAAHGGSSGVMCWLDPVHEIAGAYFEVLMRQSSDMLQLWNADLFMNVVTSAVDEA
jgi:CubicO group peptidase (beta-lactamase class C family)